MKNNIVQEKSFKFSIRIIKLYKYLISKKEYVLSKQILRSGTSIGANIEEGIGGYSKSDFCFKFSLAYKEARETKYWLKLLYETKYLTSRQFKSIISDCEDIIRILAKIQITIKK